MVNWPHNEETRASQRAWSIMSSFLSNYRSISTRVLLWSCIFTAWRHFPHFLVGRLFHSCHVFSWLWGLKRPWARLTDAHRWRVKAFKRCWGMIFAPLSGVAHLKPEGLRAPIALPAPVKGTDWGGLRAPWPLQRSTRPSESWYCNALYRLEHCQSDKPITCWFS